MGCEESVASMVLGIGFDLIDLTDFARTLERSGDRFLRRVYTKEEIEYCQAQPHSQQSYAVRFAAKEATMKALGIAGEEGLQWRDFEVILGASSQPSMMLHRGAAAKARTLGVSLLSLSLSHSESAAGAVVIAEGLENRKGLGQSSSNEESLRPENPGEMTQSSGKLFIFEGPDGVGKSTLAEWFKNHLQESGISSQLLSFPGKETGTLGRHIYELHHDPSCLGIDRLTAGSLQLLHVAAHIDAIEQRVKPLLEGGQTVVLDRFWWSTFVYGLVGGVERSVLEQMIAVERLVWHPIEPDCFFLVMRTAPLRPEPPDLWSRWREAYLSLAKEEQKRHPVLMVENDRDISQAKRLILKNL